MAIASGSGRRIAYIAEATYGATPATPTFKVLRVTGGGPRTTKATDTSKEIRQDRNVSDEMQLGQDVAGDYDFELTYGTFDDMLEAVMQGAWATNVLKNGVTPKSFTFEETLEMGATDSFSRFTGIMANSMSLAIAARAVVTGSLSLMGQKELLDTAIITDATYTAANTEPVWTSSASVASLSVLGGTPKVRSLNLEMNNNLRTRTSVGSLYSEQFGSGSFDATGTAEIYFESNALYQSVLDHGGGALSFTIGTTTLKKYTFLMPKIILGNGERRPGGNDDDVMVSLPFRAVYDATEACSLKITRAVV
jgi:hypothetical protein